MLAVIGTLPFEDIPLMSGFVSLQGDCITVEGRSFPVNRGTAALAAAAAATADVLGVPAPVFHLVGDTGVGKGSRKLYKRLVRELPSLRYDTVAFHYLQPVLDWHNRLLAVIEAMRPKPVLIADAGFMYVAKMSGKASSYDLFTPDVGELAFLADEEAPHPFYTRGFILHEENRLTDLIERAYRHGNAARYLLVKGKQDYIADESGLQGTVSHPVEAALEAIGGTGDTLTGIVSMLIDSGMDIEKASTIAMAVNRQAGVLAQPTPATQIHDIISHIPRALQSVLGDMNESDGNEEGGKTCRAR